jgi:type I restriction enzyme S subunit
MVSIEDLDVMIADGNYSSKYPRSDEFISAGVPFIRANNIINNTVSSQDMYFISKQKHKELSKGHLLENDVLITTRGNIGQVATVPSNFIDANINAQIVLLRPNSKIINYRFLMWSFLSTNAEKQIAGLQTGTALKQLPVGKLKKVKIPQPPIEIHNKIAKTLDTVSELLTMYKQQLVELDNLIRSIFYDMFGDLKSNQMGWKIDIFTSAALIDTNMTNDFETYADYPHIGIDSIEKNTGNIVNYKFVRDSNLISGKYIFSEKHIIYSKIRPNLNKVALPTFSGLCSADAYPILPKDNITNKYYLAYVLRSNYFLKYILDFSGRTNIPKVNKQQLESFRLPIPPIGLQNQFATIVTKIEEQKTLVKKAIDETQYLFDSLMSEYFD